MKLINKTTWSSKVLKKLLLLVAKKEGYKPKKVEVVYSKGSGNSWYSKGVSGYANTWSDYIRLRIPNSQRVRNFNGRSGQLPLEVLDNDHTKHIAQVFIHEIAHLRGVLNHADMESSTALNVDYVGDMVIPREEIKVKPKRDLKQERAEKAKKYLKLYQSKVKRYGNLVKKWSKKVKYYNKVLAE